MLTEPGEILPTPERAIKNPFLLQEPGPISDWSKDIHELLRLVSGKIAFNQNKFETQYRSPQTQNSGIAALTADIVSEDEPDLNNALKILSQKGLPQDSDLFNLALLYSLQSNLTSDHVSHWLADTKDSTVSEKIKVFADLTQDILANRFKTSALQKDLGIKNQPENDLFLPELTHQLLRAISKKIVPGGSLASYDALIKFAKENPIVLNIVYALEKIYLTKVSSDLARSPDKKAGLFTVIDNYQTGAKIRDFAGQEPIPLEKITNSSIKDLTGVITVLTVENWLRQFSDDGIVRRWEKNGQWMLILPAELYNIVNQPIVYLKSLPKMLIPVGFSTANPHNPKLQFFLVADHPHEELGHISTE